MSKETASRWIGMAVDFLFAREPRRTALGILVGTVLHGLSQVLLSPAIFGGLSFLFWVAVGIVTVNIKTCFFLAFNKPLGNEKVDDILYAIARLPLSEEKKEELIEKVVNTMIKDASTNQDYIELVEKIKKQHPELLDQSSEQEQD